MVGVGTFLLLCLSLFCDRGESVLNVTQLQNIVGAMYNRFNQQQLIDDIKIINNRRPNNKMAAGNQYSVALQLLRTDCDNGRLGNNIPSDFSQVRETLKMEQVYNANSIVAALPRHIYIKKNNQYQKTGSDHAEYRVLSELQVDSNPGCLIIYTHFSPCIDKCLQNNRPVNIINLLRDVKNKDANKDMVFIFSSLFHYDRENYSKDDIYNNLNQIESMPVYCCYRNRGGGVTCAEFKINGGKDQLCLSEKN